VSSSNPDLICSEWTDCLRSDRTSTYWRCTLRCGTWSRKCCFSAISARNCSHGKHTSSAICGFTTQTNRTSVRIATTGNKLCIVDVRCSEFPQPPRAEAFCRPSDQPVIIPPQHADCHDTGQTNALCWHSAAVLTEFAWRAFSVAGPTVYNSLPANFRLCHSVICFKRHLKTHLFRMP